MTVDTEAGRTVRAVGRAWYMALAPTSRKIVKQSKTARRTESKTTKQQA